MNWPCPCPCPRDPGTTASAGNRDRMWLPTTSHPYQPHSFPCNKHPDHNTEVVLNERVQVLPGRCTRWVLWKPRCNLLMDLGTQSRKLHGFQRIHKKWLSIISLSRRWVLSASQGNEYYQPLKENSIISLFRKWVLSASPGNEYYQPLQEVSIISLSRRWVLSASSGNEYYQPLQEISIISLFRKSIISLLNKLSTAQLPPRLAQLSCALAREADDTHLLEKLIILTSWRGW